MGDAEAGIYCGELRNVAYCTFAARDRDRMLPIVINGEVAVQGLDPYDMSRHFPGAMRFLHDCVDKEQKVLIHCLRGENRAGAIAAAFLVSEGNRDAEEAVALVAKSRGL